MPALCAIPVGFAGHVLPDGYGNSSVSLDFTCRLFDLDRVQIRDDNFGPFFREQQSLGFSKPPGAPGCSAK